jgi:hypothetical protein
MPYRESKTPIHVDKSTRSGLQWEHNPTLNNVVRNLASCGLPEKEIADLIGVRLATLQRRIKQIPELAEALVEGREAATQVMLAEMYKTALGGQVYQEITEKINHKGQKSVTVVTKETQANPQLQMYWMNNRDPENWKTQRQLQLEAKGTQESVHTAESDKIARLSREVFEGDTLGTEGEHTVSEETAHPTGTGTVDATDVPADVQREATDNVQDDVMDVPTEAGAEPL